MTPWSNWHKFGKPLSQMQTDTQNLSETEIAIFVQNINRRRTTSVLNFDTSSCMRITE